MNQKTKVALYPIFADTLPVARYLVKYQTNIEVIELLSDLGSCACGKDAAVLDNREPLGKRITASIDSNPNSWDVLYLLQHDILGLTDENNSQSSYASMIEIAHRHQRKIKTYPFVSDGEIFAFKSLSNKTAFQDSSIIKKHGITKPIRTYLVFVGGVISEANAFEVFLNLFGELSKYMKVAAFSSSRNAGFCDAICIYDTLYNKTLSGEQKVYAIKHEIDRKSKEIKADMILLHLDEALMPYSETQTNGYGIVPYIVSQIIAPDYSICCLPYGHTDPSFLQEFEKGLEGRFGFIPDQWHLSNVMLDFTTLTTIRDAGAIHLPINEVKHIVDDAHSRNANVCSAVIPEYVDAIVSAVLSSYQENQQIASIF